MLHFFLIWMIICVSISANSTELPNGGFERGFMKAEKFTPTGWNSPDEQGFIASPGYQSDRCIMVTGNGENDAAWISDSIPVHPGEYYEFSFWGKSGAGTHGGSAVSGPIFCNRDYRLSQRWKQYDYIFRIPDNQNQAQFRLGQWHVNGNLYFDMAELTRVQPIYNLTKDLELGEGERIDETTYVGNHVMSGQGANSCRFLEYTTARFNSNRWLFSSSSTVLYKHSLPDTRFKKASVSITVNHYTGGICRVLVRPDGSDWKEAGRISGLDTKSFELLDGAKSARTILVKLEGMLDENDRCHFQVNQYEFEAELTNKTPSIQGDTQYIRIHESDHRFVLDIKDLGNPKPGIETNLELGVANRTQEKQRIQIGVQATEKEPGKVKTTTTTINLPPRHIQNVSVPYIIHETGDQNFLIEASLPDGQKVFEGSISINIPFLYKNDFGDLISQSSEAALWWCPAMYKVSQERPAPSSGKSVVTLSAARGEYEPVQIVLRPKQRLTNVTLKAENLSGPLNYSIPARHITLEHVEYLEVTHPSDAIGCIGFWPDPLLPLTEPIKVNKNRNYPFWITVYIPRHIPGGVYKGNIHFTSNEWNTNAPLQIRVYDFEIPEHSSLKSAFGFSSGNVKRYHHLETDEEYDKVVDLYLQNFRDHRISPYNPAMLHPIKAELKEGKDGLEHFVFDFTDFDEAGRRYFDEFGFTSLRLRLVGMGSGTFHSRRKGRIGDYQQGTPGHERLFHEYASTIQDHLLENGWLDETFVYWFDEPTPKDYEFVRDGMSLIHRHAPKLQRFLTEQPEEELFGYVDIWCPVLHHADPEICQPRQKEGEEIWWYICTGPKEPYPGLFIDHHAVELRTWLWLTHKYGYQGCLVWQSNYWSSSAAFPPPDIQNPWEDPMSYVSGYGRPAGYKGYWGNGDGRFLYPPQNWNEGQKLITGPVDSYRWEMLREGMEDYEYFHLIQELVEDGSLPSELKEKGENLLSIPERIITSRTEYSKDSEDYYNYRSKLGEFIEKAFKSRE